MSHLLSRRQFPEGKDLSRPVRSRTESLRRFAPQLLSGCVLLLLSVQAAMAQRPQLSSITPTSTTAGEPGFTLTARGSNFDLGANIIWDSITLNTAFISNSELRADVSANAIRNPGTIPISVQNSDNRLSNSINFVINPAAVAPPLSISTTTLPNGTVGASYSQTLNATGGVAPFRWTVSSGSFPPGLTLGANGAITGTPTATGTFNFTVLVTDTANSTDTQVLTIRVLAAPAPVLTITTSSPLAGGTVGVAYTQTISATGGVPPYRWTLPSGNFPPGLTLNSSGVISGTPTQAGTFNFTIQVTDNAQTNASRVFSITIATAPAPPPSPGPGPVPGISLTGLPSVAGPAQQMALSLRLSSVYSSTITGDLTISFAPDAAVNATDAALQFSTGGTTVGFTIPANTTQATFPTSSLLLQTGTIAGRITLTAHLRVNGADVTPSPAPAWSAQVDRSAPRISSVSVQRSGSGFNVIVSGFSTPREVTQATFRFTPSSGGALATTEATINVNSAFQNWYRSAGSSQYGSQFTLTQPFSVQGDLSNLGSVSVILSNSSGISAPANAGF